MDRIEIKNKIRKFEIDIVDGLFTERWICEYKHDWSDCYYVFEDGIEFHTHHLEFSGEGELISPTGYMSHFVTSNNSDSINEEYILEVLKDILDIKKNPITIREVVDE